MNELDIEPASLNDIEELLTLEKLFYASHSEAHGDPTWPALAETADSLRRHIQQDLVLVARLADEIVGSIRGRVEGSTCHIDRVQVHPGLDLDKHIDIQEQLIGAIEWAAGTRRFELLSDSSTEPHNALYQRLDYHEFRREMIEPHHTVVHFEKQRD